MHFIDEIERIDFRNLPGLEAQIRMAPVNRRDDIRRMGVGKKVMHSGVLLMLYPFADGDTGVVLIQRPKYNGVHSGQISFPGGRYEKDDLDLKATALRETKEEVGVDPALIEVIGKLTDLYIPPSNHRVSPYVGIMRHTPVFRPDPVEVDVVLELPLAQFLNKENIQNIPITLADGQCLHTPCFLIDGLIIWGATAMMMAEFLQCIKKGSTARLPPNAH